MPPSDITPCFTHIRNMERRGTTDTVTIFIDEETLTQDETEELIDGKAEE